MKAWKQVRVEKLKKIGFGWFAQWLFAEMS